MREIYIYCCLLPALSTVKMKSLSKNGNVGENVTFTCSNWDGLGKPQKRVKYLCKAPCEDKDVIMKVKPEETKNKDRIKLKNTGGSLVVTFFNLQKSDAKKYYCGMERAVWDLYIEVNLKVTQGPRPKPTPVITKFSPSPAVLSSSTMSSNDTETTTEECTSSPNSSSTIPPVSATHGSGGSLYFIAVVTVMVALLLMAALVLYRIIARKPPKIVSSARDPRDDSVEVQ
ncbi:uncharacterized protein LOC115367097 [Myripristis murdjan]|uniref:uncharacterized protein LOC115367097 n=1 Tax=Myripristis murdjan TaxID=586833 RepID=UPI001175E9EC|nr:uncharacterized protein LOC115367097 [Myripristis murdjan]